MSVLKKKSGGKSYFRLVCSEMFQKLTTYVPAIVSQKQKKELDEWNRSGMPFDLIPEAQKQKKDYTKVAEELKVNEFIALKPDEIVKTNLQLQGRARYVQRLLRQQGKKSKYRKISEEEYRVYREN